MCKVKVPKTEPPAAAPPPAAPSAQVAQADPMAEVNSATDNARAKKKGRSALRIPLSTGGGAGGSGLNIPVG